ncbi:hypothetical protein [Actinopolymorpha pittospori]
MIDSGARQLPFPVDEDSDTEVPPAGVDADRRLTLWVSSSAWVRRMSTDDREQVTAAVAAALGEESRFWERAERSLVLTAAVLTPLGVCLAAAFAQWRLDLFRWELGLSWRTFVGPLLELLAVVAAAVVVAVLARPSFLDSPASAWTDSLEIPEVHGNLRRVATWLLRALAASGITAVLVLLADQVLYGGFVDVLLYALVDTVAAIVGGLAAWLLVVVAGPSWLGTRDPRAQLVADLTRLLGIAAYDGRELSDLEDAIAIQLGSHVYWRRDRKSRRRYAVMFGAAAGRVERGLPRLVPRSQRLARQRLTATAARIATTLRVHGHQVALGGLDSDDRLSEALADGLRSAAWGRWETLAVAEAPSALRRLAQRFAARTLVAVAVAVVALVLPWWLPGLAASVPELRPVLLVVAVIVATGAPRMAYERAVEVLARRSLSG